MNVFDCLKDVIKVKSGALVNDPKFKSGWSSFMMVRYLSMDDKFFAAALKANELQCTLTPKQMYKYLLAKVPSSQRTFIRYISKKK